MLEELQLPKGTWIVGNCGKHDSETHCKLVFLAPEGQKKELLDSIVRHAVEFHKNEDNPQLRLNISKLLETVKI